MLSLSLGVVVPRSGDPALMWRVASFSRFDGLGAIGQARANLLWVLALCVCGDLPRSIMVNCRFTMLVACEIRSLLPDPGSGESCPWSFHVGISHPPN
jgi:hypothetical protein